MMAKTSPIRWILVLGLLTVPQWAAAADQSLNLETVRQSPLTPWVGAAIAVLVLITILNLAMRFMARLVSMALFAALCYFGYQWWQNSDRSMGDVGEKLVQKLRASDFQSGDRLETLIKDSRQWLAGVTDHSKQVGVETARRELSTFAETLEERINEASTRGAHEAKERFQLLRDDVILKIKSLPK